MDDEKAEEKNFTVLKFNTKSKKEVRLQDKFFLFNV